LAVSAPFHCSMMHPAAVELKNSLAQVEIQAPSVPIISNVTAKPMSDAEEIRRLLVKQVCSPVLWSDSMLFLKENDVREILSIGSGNFLSALASRIFPLFRPITLDTAEDLSKFIGKRKGITKL